MAPQKAILTCAITGSIHTPSMSPHLPITAQQIANEAIAAAEAGAAILHLHARHEADGRPSPLPDDFAKFLPRIAAETDAVLNITTGGGQNMTVDDRIQAALRFKPEMCSLNMGSMNFGLYPALEKFKTFKYDWEAPYLANSRGFIFKNTFEDIETISKRSAARAAPNLNSNATTSATCTAWRIFWNAARSNHPCSCSSSSGFWAASDRKPKT